jgi:hypothetical protein
VLKEGARGGNQGFPHDLRRVPLQALFGSRPGDDPVTVAPAQLGFQLPILGPEAVELGIQRMDLIFHRRVETLREAMPELSPALAQLVDLAMDFFRGPHASLNDSSPSVIPKLQLVGVLL